MEILTRPEVDYKRMPIPLNDLALLIAEEINSKPNLNPGIGIEVITDLYLASRFTDQKISLDERVAATEIFLKALNDNSRNWLEEEINGKNRMLTIIEERKKIFDARGINAGQIRHE